MRGGDMPDVREREKNNFLMLTSQLQQMEDPKEM